MVLILKPVDVGAVVLSREVEGAKKLNFFMPDGLQIKGNTPNKLKKLKLSVIET